MNREMQVIARSAQAAYEGATHADAKAENKYDTRGLESSYLAGAQKERAADLQASIQAIRLMVLQQFSASDPIAPSAVICLEQDDRTTWCFLVTLGGGFNLTWEGQNLTTVTTQSPLGQRLVGKECGDEIALTIAGTKKTYTIASVA